MVVEEGPWIDPDAVEPFSLDELVLKYRHQGASAALGTPGIAYAEGRCVGGSTEINSGLYHRLPSELADEWRRTYRIAEFTPEVLDRYSDQIEGELSVSKLPGAPPPSSAVLERGAAKLGWRAVEFARVFKYDTTGRGVKQTMARTLDPARVEAGAQIIAECRVSRLLKQDDRIVGARCERTRPDGDDRAASRSTPTTSSCAAGRSRRRRSCSTAGSGAQIGNGAEVPSRRSRSRRGSRGPTTTATSRCTGSPSSHRSSRSAARPAGAATSRSRSPTPAATTPTRSPPGRTSSSTTPRSAATAAGASPRCPGLRAPLVTYRMTDADQSRLARGLLHLGEVLLAAGATELYPSIAGGFGGAHGPRISSSGGTRSRRAPRTS